MKITAYLSLKKLLCYQTCVRSCLYTAVIWPKTSLIYTQIFNGASISENNSNIRLNNFLITVTTGIFSDQVKKRKEKKLCAIHQGVDLNHCFLVNL